MISSLPELKVNTVVLLVLDSGVCHLPVSADVQDQTQPSSLEEERKRHLQIFFPFFMIQVLKKWNAVLGHHRRS